jgi:hypothetical protein
MSVVVPTIENLMETFLITLIFYRARILKGRSKVKNGLVNNKKPRLTRQ